MAYKATYLELYHSGELDERITGLYKVLEDCALCPRQCHKNRLQGEIGYCQAGQDLVVSSMHPHFGEEEPLVGRSRLLGIGGSGTVFLTGCNLGCIYCQNYDISFLRRGRAVAVDDLAGGMVELQNMGCHNINFVTPTHYVPQLVRSTKLAVQMGLRVPLVYNCGGYESVDTIRMLDGIVDIYMPDVKYGDPESAEKYSNAPDYVDRCREAVKEMHRQVGDLQIDESGIARRGLLVRHLVLPNGLAGSRETMRFLAEEISRDTYINIMLQYRPVYRASEHAELNRTPTSDEFQAAVTAAREFGLHRGFPESM